MSAGSENKHHAWDLDMTFSDSHRLLSSSGAGSGGVVGGGDTEVEGCVLKYSEGLIACSHQVGNAL
jgi:hypothetical protein